MRQGMATGASIAAAIIWVFTGAWRLYLAFDTWLASTDRVWRFFVLVWLVVLTWLSTVIGLILYWDRSF